MVKLRSTENSLQITFDVNKRKTDIMLIIFNRCRHMLSYIMNTIKTEVDNIMEMMDFGKLNKKIEFLVNINLDYKFKFYSD